MRHDQDPATTIVPLSRSEDGVPADRAWFDESPLPMWVCDAETFRFLEVNDAAVAHYGYRREEFLDRRVFDLHEPVNGHAGHLEELLSRGFPCSFQRKDGSVAALEVACSPIRYADRTAFFAIARDAETPAERAGRDRSAMPTGPGDIGSWEWDIETGALLWSPEVYGLLGVRPDRVLSHSEFLDRIDPGDRARYERILVESLRSHAPFALEYVIGSPEGPRRLLSSGVVMVNPQGRAARMIGTLQDVTRSCRLGPFARPAAPGSSIAEVSPVGIFRAGPDGAYDYVNSALCEMSGLNLDEALGSGWLRAVHPEDREMLATEWRNAVAEQRPLKSEYRLVRPDGRTTWVLSQSVPERTRDGRAAGSLGTVTDITERRRAEDALEQERRRLRALFDATQDAILVIDGAMRCVDANPSACELLGCSRDGAVGHAWFSLIAAPDRDRVRAAWHDLVATGRMAGEIEILRPDGSRCPVEYRAVANIVPDLHLVVMRDVTPLLRSQALLRAHARHQAALAALSQRALAGLEYEALVEDATRRTVEALDAQHGSLFELARAGDRLELKAEHCVPGIAPPARANDWTSSDARYALLVNEPILTRDLGADDRFPPDPRLIAMGLTSGVSVLVPGNGRPIGVLSVHGRAPHAFSQSDLLFLQSVANVLALAAVRMNEQEMRNRLVGRIVAARDEERRKLARELHDETGQSLTALLVGLVSVEQARTIDETRALALRLRQITARTIEDLGRLARGLHPSILTDMGLAEAARRHVADFERSCGIPIQIRIRGLDEPRLRPRLETTLYRILQEALTNAARHSRAGRIDVGLFRSGDDALLVVKDDGVGFDAGAQLASTSRGLGLHGMKERAARSGGILTIDSSPGNGTRLIARLPIRPIRPANRRPDPHGTATEDLS